MKQWLIVLLSFLLASLSLTANAQAPSVEWSRGAGGSAVDGAYAVAHDAAGNVYVTGSFAGSGISFGGLTTPVSSQTGSEDVYIVKYNSAGVAQWVRTAGAPGGNADRGLGIAVDNRGNLYVAGYFNGTIVFPGSSLTLTSAGQDDGFVAKYDVNGNFLTAVRVGGAGRDQSFGVTTDVDGNVYVVGQISGTVNINAVALSSAGDYDVYVSKWDSNLRLIWVNTIGSPAQEQAFDVKIAGNDLYVSGYYSSTATFNSPSGNIVLNSNGGFDAFIAQYNATTGSVNWVRRGGGAGNDYGYGVAVDPTGIYTVGRYLGPATFSRSADVASVQSVNSIDGSEDIFLAKYSTSGDLIFVRTTGSASNDFATEVATDGNGTVYVAGQYQRAFNYVGDSRRTEFNLPSPFDFDIFVARYNSSGDATYVTSFRGASFDEVNGSTFVGGAFYIVGNYSGTIEFGSTPALFNNGGRDAYTAKIQFGTSTCDLATPTISLGTATNCSQLLTAQNTAGATSFVWRREGTIIPGATGSSFTATASGNYTVEIANAVCSRTSSAVFVSVSSNFTVFAGNSVSINAGQTTTLTASVTGGSGNISFVWRDAIGNVVGTSASVTVSPNITTDYTVTATDGNGCTAVSTVRVNVQSGACLTSADVTISIVTGNDNIPATTSIAEICIGQKTSLQASSFLGNNNFRYQWFREGNILAGEGSALLESIVIDGNYSLRVTPAVANGCPTVNSNNTIQVQTFQIPNAVASSNQAGNTCSSQPITLTAQGSGGTPFTQPFPAGVEDGYRYRWEPADAIIGSNTQKVVTANPARATTFTVTVSDRISCGRTTTITVNQGAPDISVTPGGPINICSGTSAILTANLSGSGDFTGTITWRRGGTAIAGALGNTLTVNTPGVYTAVYTVRNCVKVSNEVVVSVGTTPVANAGPDRVICTGQSTTIGTSGSAAFTYQWLPTTGVANPNSPVTTVNPSFTTVYTLTVTSPNCGSSIDEVVVTVNSDFAVPTISAAGATSVCQGQTVQLLVNNFDPTLTYTWRRGGVVIPGETGAFINATLSGSYTVVATGPSTCGNPNKQSNAITVSVLSTPVANAGPDRIICQGSSTSIGSGAVSGLTYQWNPPFGLSSSNVANPVARPDVTTVYVLTVFNGPCASAPDDVTVTVVPAPVRPLISANGPTTFCAGGSVQISIDNFDPNVRYTWTRDGVVLNVGNTPSIFASQSGTYSATIFDRTCGTISSNGINVQAIEAQSLPVPKIYPFGSQALGICQKRELKVWALLKDGYGYQWWKDGEVIPGATSNEYMVVSKGVYHVQVFLTDGSNNNCTSKKSEGLFVTDANVAEPTVDAGPDREICPESNVCIIATGSTGHPNKRLMFWVDPDTLLPVPDPNIAANQQKYCVKPISGQQTTYTIYVKDDYGCVAMDQVTVNVKSVPKPEIVVEAMNSSVSITPFTAGTGFVIDNVNRVCDSVMLSVSNGPLTGSQYEKAGQYNYLRWHRVAENTTFNRNTRTFTPSTFITAANATNRITATRGIYAVEASIDGCPVLMDTIRVFMEPSPRFTVNNPTVCEGNAVTISSTITNGVGSVTYQWSGSEFNGSPSLTTSSVSVRPSVTQNYGLVVTRTYGTGDAQFSCSNSAESKVTVIRRFVASDLTFSENTRGFIQGTDGVNEITTCANGQLTFEAPVFEGYSYTWEFSSSINGAYSTLTGVSGNRITIAASRLATSGTRFIRYRINNTQCGGVTGGAARIIIQPVPTVTADGTRNICWGETVELYRTGGTTGANVTWEWSTDEGVITNNPGTSAARNFITVNSDFYPDTTSDRIVKNYVLTVTDANGCKASATVGVTLNNNRGPVALATVDKGMICHGTPITLMGWNIGATLSEINTFNSNRRPNSGFLLYRWNGPSTVDNPTGLLASGVVLNPNNRFTGTNSNNNRVPDLVLSGDKAPSKTTTYTLTITAPNSECVATCPVTVTVGEKLVATILNVEDRTNLCDGPVTLRAICNSANPGIQYQWYVDYNGKDNWVLIPGATQQEFKPTTGGRYNVVVYLPETPSCYDDADNFVTLEGVRSDAVAADLVTVKMLSEWQVLTKSAVVCRGQSIALNARYIFGASYQWYRVDGPTSMPTYTLLPGEDNHILTVSTPGKYRVLVTAGCVGCPNVCEIWSQICPVVFVPEIRPTINHAGHIELCDGKNYVDLYTQGDTDGYKYEWYIDRGRTGNRNNAVLIAGENGNRLRTNEVGDYWVKVTTKFCPTVGPNCEGWSTNFVPVRACSTGYCPLPTNVRMLPSKTDCSKAIVRWDQPFNTSQYNLTGDYQLQFRRASDASFGSVVTVSRATEFELTGLTPNTPYVVEVRSLCDRPTTSSYWVRAEVATTCNGAGSPSCAVPTNFARTVSGSNVTATWAAVSGATSYEVQVIPFGSGAPISQTTAGTSVTFNGLPDGTHTIQVRANCSATLSSAFTSLSFTIGGAPCNAIALSTTEVATTQTELTVTWELPAEGDNPRTAIFVDLIPFANLPFVESPRNYVRNTLPPNATTTTFSGLTPGTLYQVRLYSDCNGTISDPIFAENLTQPAVTNPTDPRCNPISFIASNVSANQISLAWNPVTGATDYSIRWRVRGAASFNPSAEGVNTAATTFTIPEALLANTMYEINIRVNGVAACPTNGFLDTLWVMTSPAVLPAVQAPALQLANRGCTTDNLQFFDFNWVDNGTAIDGYQLEWGQRGQDPSLWFRNNSILPGETSFRIQAMLGDNQIWYARIRSVNNSVTPSVSEWSYAILVTSSCPGAKTAASSLTTANSFVIYPNPNQGNFTISYNATKSGEISLSVMDVTGRAIVTETKAVSEGSNDISVNLANEVAPGIYMLQIKDASKVHTAKIIVE